jgi:hypothetical protein
MTELPAPDSFWGSVTGIPIVRKMPPVLPPLPSLARCFYGNPRSTEWPVLSIECGISAPDLLVATRYGNKLFESFELSGHVEFQASFVLFARALGAGHKVAGHDAFLQEREWLTDEQLTDLAYAAQDGGVLHGLGLEMQSRTNGDALCDAMAVAIKAQAQALGLTVQDRVSRTTVSRYLTISRASSGIPALEVRISDHGGDGGAQRINLRLRDSVEPVLLALRQRFGFTQTN